MNELHDSSPLKRTMRWGVRAALGLLLILVSFPLLNLAGLLAFAFPFFISTTFLTRCLETAIFFLCLCGLSLGGRLMEPIPNQTGLLSPFALRFGALVMATPPIIIIMTGRSSSWSPLQYVQACLFVLAATGMLVAAWHKAAGLKRKA